MNALSQHHRLQIHRNLAQMVREVGHPHEVGSSHELLPLSGEHKGVAVGFLPRANGASYKEYRKQEKSPSLPTSEDMLKNKSP